MSVWRYVENGQACGPVELEALKGLIANGRVGPDTLVWQPGMANWLAVRAVPELASSIPLSTPPPINIPPPYPMLDDAADIAQNKILAAVSYLGPLIIIPLLAAPNSKFTRFHCNQGIVLLLSFFVVYGALWVFSFVPFFLCLLAPFHLAAWLAFFFLVVVGVMNASGGVAKPLPWIGHCKIIN